MYFDLIISFIFSEAGGITRLIFHENCSDSIYSPVIKDLIEELGRSDNQEIARILRKIRDLKRTLNFSGKGIRSSSGSADYQNDFWNFLASVKVKLNVFRSFSESD